MGKSGRPRKSGERHRCGKRTRAQVQDDIKSTAVYARMRIFGVSKEVAGTNIMGSPLGRLVHWRVISQAQADAGYDFAMVMREYLASTDQRKPTQGKAGFVPVLRSNEPPEDDAKRAARVKAIESKAKAYMEALGETDPGASPSVTSIVWRVCIDEQDVHGDLYFGALRVGLNAIHRILYGRKAA